MPLRLCTRLLDYLTTELQRVLDVEARRRLRSSSTSALVAPRTPRYHWRVCGDPVFAAPAASVWKRLQELVRVSPSLSVYSQ